MRKIFIILFAMNLIGCQEKSDPVTPIQMEIVKESGSSNIGLSLIVLDGTESVQLQNIPRFTGQEITKTAVTSYGTPFVLAIVNDDRYTRLRIHLDRTGHPRFTRISIPETNEGIRLLIFNNGDLSRTQSAEQTLRQELSGFPSVIVERGNY
jgi:hypothetical protein